jgi:uncharacterized membrane protein
MEEYCVWTRRMGPRCYTVTPQQKRNVETLATLTALLFVVVIVLVFANLKDVKWKPYLMAVWVLTLMFFIWYFVYEMSITKFDNLICSGARQCSGRSKH